METLQFTFCYSRKTLAELTDEERTLVQHAREATYRSYAPYSHFSVGAAALLDDGTILTGSNQENSSYPQSQCAERTTVFYANSLHPDRAVRALCIAARGTDGAFTSRPITPCGGCRQVLSETEDRQKSPMKILLCGTDEVYIINTVKDLLPISFDTTYL